GGEEGLSYKEMKGRVTSELRKIFRPELLNRIDEIIVFHKLERAQMREIIEVQVKRFRKQLAEREVSIEFTTEALDKLAEEGYDPAFGARPLRRTLQRMVEDPMSEMILKGEIPNGSKVTIEPNDKTATILARTRP
ncbi:MAG: NDP-hexose 4-ketoreductase, partial [Actinomycetota bacterium]|nr:NDP-hexose 4-ketoreductase [Actinomycetota bacterium]